MIKWKIAGFIATVIIVLIIPIYGILHYIDKSDRTNSEGTAEFIGAEKCAECHKAEFDLWIGSHHERSMDFATDSSALGNFNNVEVEFNGKIYKFYKRDGKFFAFTEGPGGVMAEFEITHTFGYTPLQQYLVPFENGKYQCLPIAWNTEKKQWFDLTSAVHPNEKITPDNWLYWTNQSQNWNGMCAECHSTDLKKNFDPVNKIFNTSWSEINVSCEACHGPGSKHADWANLPELARPGDVNTGLVVKTSGIDNKEYVEICARCHSRRSLLGDFDHSRKNILDSMTPELLNELYFPDGQILDEDYVYGSFLQSKMYDKDVKCSDCHNVHSGKLIFEGNKLCRQCHRSDVYGSYNHHFHKLKGEKGDPLSIGGGKIDVGEGAECINCHMPGRFYMGNDFRNDHSFRIPRPDLTISIKTPNACNQCHSDKSPEWAEKYITKWYGIKRKPHYGEIIATGRLGLPDAEKDLISLSKDELYPLIVRATALSLLKNFQSDSVRQIIKQALDDPEHLIRLTAVRTYNIFNTDSALRDLSPLLLDRIKSVRTQAAFRLSELPMEKFPQKLSAQFKSAVDEYIKSNEYNSDFTTGRFNLGVIYARLGKIDKSIENYIEAMKIDDLFYPAKMNLALIYNELNKNEKAETLYRQVIDKNPNIFDAYYSLGLLLAEEKKYEESVVFLRKAAVLIPDRARIHYNLGLLLQILGKMQEAEKELISALHLEPENYNFLYALTDHYIKTNNFVSAKSTALKMSTLFPDNQKIGRILDYIASKLVDK